MAGQVVSEGFLRWRVSPVFRRVLTRAIGLVPSMAVAIAAGRSGVDTMLVASQVALSIVLPFIVLPLLYLTGSSGVMTVRRVRPEAEDDGNKVQLEQTESIDLAGSSNASTKDVEAAVETVDYSNNRFVAAFAWLLWLVLVAANVYAIVTLGLGQD